MTHGIRKILSHFSFLILLGLTLTGGKVHATSVAEFGYTLLNGDCPNVQGPNKSEVNSSHKCLATDLRPRQLELLRQDMGTISEGAYLAGLADERNQALNCAQDQISNLLSKPQDQEIFAADISEKLIALLREKKKMVELRPSLGYGSSDKNPKDPLKPGSPLDQYKKARARAEAILNYLPFTQAPAMQKLIAHISSQDDFIINEKVDPVNEKYIQDTIKKTLPIAQREIGISIGALNKAVQSNGLVMDDLTRESLAQDTDLIESFRQKNTGFESSLKPIACRVDAKFGKGAQYRDNTLLAASILGAVVGAGLPALVTRGFAAEVTGAASRGAMSYRSAGIMRASSFAVDTSLMMKQLQKACFSDLSEVGGKMDLNSGRCESSVLTTLANDNCTLSTVMNALGAPGAFRNLKQSLEMVKMPASKAKYLKTPAGNLREDRNHFENYQRLLQAGRIEEAQKLESKVQDTLSKGDFKVVSDIGGTSKGGGKFVKFPDGTLGVWKPAQMKLPPYKGTLVAPSEVAAYKLDRYLELNQVPLTVERKLDGEAGTVQLLVGDLKKMPLKDDPEELLLFDYLIANRDRHDENYLLTKSGSIVAIDHGLALQKKTAGGGFKEYIDEILTSHSSEPDVRVSRFIRKEKAKDSEKVISKARIEEVRKVETANVRAKTIQELSAIVGRKESYLKLKNTSDQEFTSLLKDQLSTAQIEQLLKRRKEIVESVESARSKFGDDIFRAGPASPVREIHNDLSD